MYDVSRRIEIDAGHRIPFHGSKCRRLHGHRYVIIATIQRGWLHEDPVLKSEMGMVEDFGNMKAIMMKRIHEVYDHRLILWKGDILVKHPAFRLLCEGATGLSDGGIVTIPYVPTAERLAQLWYDELLRDLPDLLKVEVHETPNCVAVYHPVE